MGVYKGQTISYSLFGESHGEAIGMVVTGFPPGMALDLEALAEAMAKRRPGSQTGATPRSEADAVNIVSGLKDGVTTGAPICGLIANTNQHSQDYQALSGVFRPSHADYSAYVKYGEAWDGRGGGQFSGRLTAPMVFAGALCSQYLRGRGISIQSKFKQIGPFKNCQIGDSALTALLLRLEAEKDSVGAVVTTSVTGLPAGLGGPDFDSLEGQLGLGLFAIPGLKGLAFGSGFNFGGYYGSEANDAFLSDGDQVWTGSNHNGGILGGITIGTPLVFDTVFKPTASIGKAQQTVNRTKERVTIEIGGRHDACIAIRGIWAVEAVTAMVLMDMIMSQERT